MRHRTQVGHKEVKVKHLLLVIPITLFLNCQAVFANEVTKCFEIAWAHPNDRGLGLNRGQAVELCNGASNAVEVIACFAIAWEHPDNGGLGLNRGQAVRLCNRASDAVEIIRCFQKAWGHPDNRGLGLHRGGAIDLCAPSRNR